MDENERPKPPRKRTATAKPSDAAPRAPTKPRTRRTAAATGVEPAAHPHEVFDVTRPDAARPGFGIEAALRNAPRRTGEQFLVPKVVE